MIDRKCDTSDQDFGRIAVIANEEEISGLEAGVGEYGKLEEKVAGSE